MEFDILKKCMLCPRNCGVDRYKTFGVCGADYRLKIAHYSVHMWEEPIISGRNGSGTIFFSNCNLKCIFCQNKKISTDGYGKYVSDERFKNIILGGIDDYYDEVPRQIIQRAIRSDVFDYYYYSKERFSM